MHEGAGTRGRAMGGRKANWFSKMHPGPAVMSLAVPKVEGPSCGHMASE